MTTITINITEADYKALTFVANSPEEWAQNVVSERARIATDDIVKLYTENALNTGVQIPTTKDAIINDAFAQGWVIAAADIPNEPPIVEPTI